jgi:hypothetical protein
MQRTSETIGTIAAALAKIAAQMLSLDAKGLLHNG